LQTALALWRGRPLTGLDNYPGRRSRPAGWDHLRLQAERCLIDARLALGQHLQVVAELQQLAQQHPYDEPLHAALMLALYRFRGRPTRWSSTTCCATPSPKDWASTPARRSRTSTFVCFGRTLAGNAARHRSRRRPRRCRHPRSCRRRFPRSPAAVPCWPSSTRWYPMLSKARHAGRPALPRWSSRGVRTAGVGKPRWRCTGAHRVADQFPDGQLYVNLRGYDPAGAPLDPAEVIRQFLQALGVPAHLLPPDLDAQIGLYRSVLAGKRTLIVLDKRPRRAAGAPVAARLRRAAWSS